MMNKKGAWVASLTVLVFAIFLMSSSILKERNLGEIKINDTAEIPGKIIDIAIAEEESKFFLKRSFEYAGFNALKELGKEGGILNGQICEKIGEHVIWRDNCFFSEKLEDNFVSRFRDKFSSYLNEIGAKINFESDHDTKGKFFLKTAGIFQLQNENINYGFEPGIIFYPDYDFNVYSEILKKANECLKKEREKGPNRNNLFEDCRNDKDLNWNIKVQEGYVLFDVSKPYKDFGEITIMFSLPE